MDIVLRLLLRKEIDPVEHDLSVAQAAWRPDFARIHELKVEVSALNGGFPRLVAARPNGASLCGVLPIRAGAIGNAFAFRWTLSSLAPPVADSGGTWIT